LQMSRKKPVSTPLLSHTSPIERLPKPSEMPNRVSKANNEGWAVIKSLRRASLENNRDFIIMWD